MTAFRSAEYPQYSRRAHSRNASPPFAVPSLSPIRLLLSAFVVTLVAACSNPAGPTPPAGGAPVLSCPADVVWRIAEGGTGVVDYPPPQVSGGTAPVNVTCVQPAGSSFPIGTTAVACTATDSASRTAQCGFSVSVALIPRLKGTKILAFGDSITWGTSSPPQPMRIRSAGEPGSYPAVLLGLLQTRYAAQTITVINEGLPGEHVTQTGEDRLDRVVDQHRPDVVIVMEGVNDMNDRKNPNTVSDTLRLSVRRVVRMNVPLVMVSTVLPVVEGRGKVVNPAGVDALNAGIRSWAVAERAVLVDGYTIMAPMKELLIGQDGLHPTPAGFEFIANMFFEAIQQHFELPAPAAPASATAPSWPFTMR